MDSSLHFFDDSAQVREEDVQADNEPTGGDDIVFFSHGSTSEKESRADPSSKTPEASKETQSYREASPTNVAGYDQESKYDSEVMMNQADSPSHGQLTSSATTTGAKSEFDAIAREAALLLDKKLENNRVWVQRLLNEMTVYAQSLAEVHSSYCRIQELEHNESQRLDQVEPDVQGATSHLLDNPYIAGLKNHFSSGDTGSTALGSKRKTDQA